MLRSKSIRHILFAALYLSSFVAASAHAAADLNISKTVTSADSGLEAGDTVTYDIVINNVGTTPGFDVVVITMADQQTGVLRRVTQAGLPVDIFERSKAETIPLATVGDLLIEDLRISESYFYPIEKIIQLRHHSIKSLYKVAHPTS